MSLKNFTTTARETCSRGVSLLSRGAVNLFAITTGSIAPGIAAIFFGTPEAALMGAISIPLMSVANYGIAIGSTLTNVPYPKKAFNKYLHSATASSLVLAALIGGYGTYKELELKHRLSTGIKDSIADGINSPEGNIGLFSRHSFLDEGAQGVITYERDGDTLNCTSAYKSFIFGGKQNITNFTIPLKDINLDRPKEIKNTKPNKYAI